MVRGLFWLPLLAIFAWLAWSGWKEYQKVEAYRVWARDFQRAKYDLYAVLAQEGDLLTWGQPTRQGPKNLATFSLADIESLRLLIDGTPTSLETLPSQGKNIALEFTFSSKSHNEVIQIPFMDLAMAAEWCLHLQKEWLETS